MIDVEVPTHVASVIDFHVGPGRHARDELRRAGVALRATSRSTAPRARSRCPIPNTFGGPVQIKRTATTSGATCRSRTRTPPQSRGIGLVDMVRAQRAGRPHRASGELACHVLELMELAIAASDDRPTPKLDDDAASGRRRSRPACPTTSSSSPPAAALRDHRRRLHHRVPAARARAGARRRGRRARVARAARTARALRPRARSRRRRASSARSREMVPHVDVVAFFGPNFTRVDALEEIAAAVRDGRAARGA